MTSTLELIALFDRWYERPDNVSIGDSNGRIIYSEDPGDLWRQVDPEAERVPSFKELIALRVAAFEGLYDAIPYLNNIEGILVNRNELVLNQIAASIQKEFERIPENYNIWKTRLTSSTCMVRVEGSVYFYDGNPFDTREEYISAFSGEQSDGGIPYNEKAIQRIQESPEASLISYEQYLAAQGGNFNGESWYNHPIFSAACPDNQLFAEYVLAMQILNLNDLFNQGFHCGWRPGEMRPGFGRPIALGYKADAFYPPNNDTVDHAALVLATTNQY